VSFNKNVSLKDSDDDTENRLIHIFSQRSSLRGFQITVCKKFFLRSPPSAGDKICEGS